MEATNHITQHMATFVRYQPFLGQDRVPFTWGIWRYFKDGVIEEAKYDYNTETIGPYTFKEQYGWIADYYTESPCPPKQLLYKYMLESQSALACIFVNNAYVCRVFADCLEYIKIEDPMKRDVRYHSTPIEMTYVVNVGWVKTKVNCFSVCHIPWRLQMNVFDSKVYVGNGRWVTPDGQPWIQESIDFPMYKELLKNESAVAVYKDLTTGELKFI